MPERSKPPRHDGDIRRQVVTFSFYRVLPEWRRLPREQRDEQGREFADVIGAWRQSEDMTVLTYSTVGMRSDCDFMLWRICYSVECLQQMQKDLRATRLGGYVHMTHNFLGMTKRSQYVVGRDDDPGALGVIRPGAHRYALVMPFTKTRAWYQLPFEQRQRIVHEFIAASRQYPRVIQNTTYSFGLDDNEFVLAFESNHPEDFVDMCMDLRETENYMYVLRDTPMILSLQCTPEEMLERLG